MTAAKTLRRSLTSLSCFFLATYAGPVWAQAQGFALNRFDPSEHGSDWFANESLDLRGSGDSPSG